MFPFAWFWFICFIVTFVWLGIALWRACVDLEDRKHQLRVTMQRRDEFEIDADKFTRLYEEHFKKAELYLRERNEARTKLDKANNLLVDIRLRITNFMNN